MRVLLTGADGRLGSALQARLIAHGHAVSGYDVTRMDVTDWDAVRAAFDETEPELVVHCAALTAVDHCAEDPDRALLVNGLGTQTVAQACQDHDARLVYISTNEVFDGRATRPYLEYDTPNPINPYGYSKWVGEQFVRQLVSRHMIVRTAWLYAHGGNNFVHAILRAAREGQPLRVVTNEIGSPTYTNDLADALVQLIETGRSGTYHLVNEGHVSRYGLARCALDLAGYRETPVEPIALAEYRRASRPPEYSALRNFAAAQMGIRLRPWPDALAAFLRAEGLLQE